MSKEKNQGKPGRFCWNELATTDVAGATKFYKQLLGWKAKPFGKNSPDYTLFKKGKHMIGGMLKCPAPGVPAHWVPYVIVKDVDASVKQTAKLRGKILMKPFDIKSVGRIAVLRDPQGAVFGILTPE